jgi:hypothetical protein
MIETMVLYNLQEGTMTRFKTPDQLHEERDQIERDHEAKWAAVFATYKLTRAVLDDDSDVVAKASGPELELARSDADRLRGEFDFHDEKVRSGLAAIRLQTELAETLNTVLTDRRFRLSEWKEEAARSCFVGGWASIPARSGAVFALPTETTTDAQPMHPPLRRRLH